MVYRINIYYEYVYFFILIEIKISRLGFDEAIIEISLA